MLKQGEQRSNQPHEQTKSCSVLYNTAEGIGLEEDVWQPLNHQLPVAHHFYLKLHSSGFG